jgi:hypothetical protein
MLRRKRGEKTPLRADARQALCESLAAMESTTGLVFVDVDNHDEFTAVSQALREWSVWQRREIDLADDGAHDATMQQLERHAMAVEDLIERIHRARVARPATSEPSADES